MASDYPIEGDKLKKLIKKSRSMPIPFGFNPGTSDDEDEYLAAHARKAPEILGKLALNEGAGTKTSFGTFAVDGSEVHLTCFKTIPQLAKKFKKYLKRFKITLNCVVMDPEGNVIDSDVETLDDWFQEVEDREDAAADAAEAAAAAEVEPDNDGIDPAELAKRLRALQPKIAAAPPGVIDRVTVGLAGAVGLIKSGRLEQASITIAQLEAIMARLAAAPRAAPEPRAQGTPPPAPPQPPTGAQAAEAPPNEAPAAAEAKADPRLPRFHDAVEKLSQKVSAVLGNGAGPLLDELARIDGLIGAGETEAALGALRAVQENLRASQAAREKWDQVHASVEPLVTRALAEHSVADVDGLRTRWNFAENLVAEGGWDRALAAVPGIVAILRTPATAPAAGAPPVGVVAFQRARIVWQGAQGRMVAEAQKLVDEIIAQSADDEDAAEIAAGAREILAEVAQVDNRLQGVLDRLTVAPEGAARDALKREAAGVIAEYRQVLSGGVFPLMKNNPFTTVAVAETADTALAVVAGALAA
ncbi:MAG: hypothetical protein ACT4OK_15035 [Gemmobacter sp.]